MKRDLYSQKLLISSDNFIQQMQWLDRADNPKLIFQLVIRWTKGQPLLTKKLLRYVLEFPEKIVRGTEAITVERIIRNRLIKEFKKDDLTLLIRKLLYGKDLLSLLKKTNGQVTRQKQIYLQNLQSELGLSDSQAKAIEQQCLQVFASSEAQIVHQPDRHALVNRENLYPDDDSYQDLILLIEKSPLYHQLNPELAIEKKPDKPNLSFFQKKSSWLYLAIPLLLLLIKSLVWKEDSQLITAADVSLKQSSCANILNNKSPRMSMGEKLLTQKYSYPETSKKAILYEGTAAFASCEYTEAQNKFQIALKANKNNPEALIYLNNARAVQRGLGGDYMRTSPLSSELGVPHERHRGIASKPSTKAMAQRAVQEAIDTPNFKIAVSVPLDNTPEIAWEILRGVAQAQTEINKQGGINGKLLLIEIVSDDNNPEIARQLARQLAADTDILAVVGHSDDNASLAASNIYQKQELVMVSPTSSGSKLSGIGSYIMRTTPSVSVLAKTLSDYASISSLKRIAVCFDSDSSDSNSFSEKFTTEITANGGQIIPVDCDFARNNFNPVPIVERATALNADAILLSPSLERINLAVAVAQVNQQRLPLLASPSLYTFETIKTGQEAVAGMVLSAPWLPGTSSDSDFSQTSKDLWGGKVNWRTAMAYDATKAIAQGLESSNSRAELQSMLNKSDFWIDGATGKFRFQKGDRLSKVQLAYIVESEQGTDNYEFVQLDTNLSNK